MPDLPPIAPPIDQVPIQPPAYKLFKHTAVTLATFLGSILAGAVVMAINYKRLGRPWAMLGWLVGGIVALGATSELPDLPGSSLLWYGAAQVLIMHSIAKARLKSHLDKHLLAGGKLTSLWWAAGVGVICLVLILPAVVAVSALTEKAVQISPQERIVYSGTATANEAMALGKALQEQGYFDGKAEVEVELSKSWWGMPEITFTIGGKFSQEMAEPFRRLGNEIAGSVGGLPVTIKLVNEYYITRRTMTVR